MVQTFGFLSLFSLLLSGGMMSGLPLGMPPLENDPVIAHVAPDECLVYVAWNGMAAPSADSPNYTEQLMADVEVRRFATEVTDRLLDSIRKNAGGGENAQQVANELTKLLQAVATSPTAIYVGTPTPLPSVGIVCRVGDQAAELERSLEKLESIIADQPGTITEDDGIKIHHWPVSPAAPPLQWGVVDDCLMIAFGPGEFQKVVARKKSARTPAWLTRIQERMPVERVANIVHVNTKAILKNAEPILLAEPTSLRILEALGLNRIQSYTCVTGLDKTDCVARTWINTSGPATGLLKFVNVEPLGSGDLDVVPADSRIAFAVRLDPAMVFRSVLEITDIVEPGSSREIRSELEPMEDAFGMSLEKDVLQSLGDSWRIYQSESEGGSLYTGWTGVVSVRNAEKLRNVMNVLKGFFAAQNGPLQVRDRRQRQVRMQSYMAGDQEIFFLNFIGEDSPIAPAWCVTDDELIVSVFPQGVTAYLNRKDSTPRLAQTPDFENRFHSNPIAILHYDTAEIFNSVYPLVQIGANFLLSELQQEGIDLDISLLPSAPAISQYLRPGGISVAAVDDGIEILNRRTLPAGIESLAMVAPGFLFGVRMHSPMGGASALGELLSPTRARQNQSRNNMKQLGLAFHNFHDVHDRFAPAITKDKNGKPGLSWRVQLLPFIDQAPLFNAFHLDEPWDSEHNRKLIELMPPTFRAPGSRAEPFRTNYVGLRVEGSILPPDGNGVGIRDVTDGTSNTIMIVEADDEHAVIWTKPDDLDFDPAKPLVGLASPSVRNGFQALMTDGAVRFISANIDEETLRNLVIRNDGNTVGEF